jgi:hypothetical protein
MATWAAKAETEARWRERVGEWRASGKKLAEFSEGQPYAASTLRYWASRLKRGEGQRFVRLVPKSARESTGSELVIEVASARVRVARGFDAALLGEVVRALGGGGR